MPLRDDLDEERHAFLDGLEAASIPFIRRYSGGKARYAAAACSPPSTPDAHFPFLIPLAALWENRPHAWVLIDLGRWGDQSRVRRTVGLE